MVWPCRLEDDIDVGVARSKKDLLNWKRDPIKRLKDAMITKKFGQMKNNLI